MSTERRLPKQSADHGVPWEEAYGYAQAVKVGNTIYISGQLSHDQHGNVVGPAKLDGSGKIIDSSNIELQMRMSYENAARLLQTFGASLDNVVEDVIYVTDFDAAFAVAGEVRKAAYKINRPVCASTIVGVTRLAFPEQMVEISFTAVLPE